MPKTTDSGKEQEDKEPVHYYNKGSKDAQAGEYSWAHDIIKDVFNNTRSDVLRSKLNK